MVWINRKPGSVLFGHLSSPQVAFADQAVFVIHLRAGTLYADVSPCSRQGLPLEPVT